MTTVRLNPTIDLDNPNYYNNRELSWLSFNKRVLEEALDQRNPLLERLKFLAIFSSNLDEFFMVRVAGLKDQVKAGYKKPENKAGLTPKQQLKEITHLTHELVHKQYQNFNHMITKELYHEKIQLLKMEDLTEEQLIWLEEYFDEQVFPVLTPLAVDAYHAFPMLLNKSLNIAIMIEDPHDSTAHRIKKAIVQVPAVLHRIVRIDSSDQNVQLVLLEDLISHFISKLFKGYKVVSCTLFRITRNADLEIHEEGASDLLEEIEEELKKRKWGAAVRLEIQHTRFDPMALNYLIDELEIHKEDIYEIDGPLDLTILFRNYKEIAKIREGLTYEPYCPQILPELSRSESIFQVLSKKDLFLHHPFDSFKPVIQFITEAASDPDVLAIKQTLYRVSGDSPIVEALKVAAEKGKQVTVLVELKARFDEENNVQWAKELEKSGCHVIYGINNLKTHSKITLVIKRKNRNIECFVHLGTGNYNDQTAKIYTDMAIMTSNRKIGADAISFFNYLSGYTLKPSYHYLSVSPFNIRNDLLKYIDQEINYHQQFGNGRIIAKMNAFTDKILIKKLYEASIAGVKIDLMIRGVCCLRPGIKGISENITVRSIVGRFLEHSRVYYFHHNGEEKLFLSSADLMTRNMENRVEILFPVFDGGIKKRIKEILSIYLLDNMKVREQDEYGQYHYVPHHENDPMIVGQELLLKKAQQNE